LVKVKIVVSVRLCLGLVLIGIMFVVKVMTRARSITTARQS
jgi:hypothetical protein